MAKRTLPRRVIDSPGAELGIAKWKEEKREGSYLSEICDEVVGGE